MAYLIYTNGINLSKTYRAGLVRIPRSLEKRFNLYEIRKGDIIYLCDFDTWKIHGPLTADENGAKEEKNPKQGPFNGLRNSEKHYHYLSIQVDCSRVFTRGVPVNAAGFDHNIETFSLRKSDELRIIEGLNHINSEKIPLVINIKFSGDEVNATVIEINRGTHIGHFKFGINKNFLNILNRKKKAGENLLQTGEMDNYKDMLKEIGLLVYDNIFRNIGLEKVFTRGGFIIDIAGDDRACEIPFEIAYKDSFIFEKKLLACRGDGEQESENVKIKRVLILADLSGDYRGAYQEGLKLYNFLQKIGMSVDLLCRNLKRDMLTDFFSFYDIIHFSGHSSIRGSDAAWDLGEALFTAADILGVKRFPRLVFSSACGNTLTLGLDFLKAGVSNVVSSRWKITDEDISDFVLSFYELLFNHMEIGYAFNRALCNSYMNENIVPLSFAFLGESRLLYDK